MKKLVTVLVIVAVVLIIFFVLGPFYILEEGQQAVVTLETWPEREVSPEVTSIAPKSTNRQGIISYEVHLSLEPEELPIRTGMTANADLVTSQC